MIRLRIPAFALLLFANLPLGAQEPSTNAPAPTATNSSDTATNLPPPTSVPTTIGTPTSDSRVTLKPGTMQLQVGFRLLLAAAEPDVINPVAMAFDAEGRLFVAEDGLNSGDGVVKRLEDLNGDGRFDRVSLFAGGVASPTAIVCYGAGVFVASGSEIIYLADSDGDGKAESRQVIYSGLTTDANDSSAGVTHLVWGPDSRIHAACAGVTGTLKCEANPSVQPLSIAGHDFMFNPRTLAVELEAGGDSLGLTYDNAGRRFTTSHRNAFKVTVADISRTSVNPLYHWPSLQSALTAADWRIYPLKSSEQSKGADSNLLISRTPVSRFTSPRSLLAYRGTALPKAFENSLFVADPALRIISRWETTDGSTTPNLQRPNLNRTTEFLASRDPVFRPNQIIAGPDGALYVADLGRERLEESAERGRIWRLQPDDQAVTKAPALSRLPSIELVKLLGNPNGWVRDTAARLLFERNEPEAYRTTAKELRWNWNPMCKAQALQVLTAGNSLNEAVVIRGLQDKDANVRATAAALCARIISDRGLAPTLLGQLSAACRDASPSVRLEAALTLGGVNHTSVPVMLASALRPAPADPWIQSAVLTSAHPNGAAAVLGQLVGDANVHRDPSGWSFLRQLARQAGLESRLKLDELLALLEASGLRIDDQLLLAGDIGESLFATGRSFVSGSSTNASRFFGRRALELAIGGNAAATRAEAIRFLGVSGFTMKEAGDWLLVMLAPAEPEAVQLAAVDALAHFPDPRVTDTFVQRWPRLNANVQAAIITRMLEQFDRTHALMAALEARTIAPAALTDVQVNFLRNHRDQTIAARATQLYGARTELNLSRIADAVSQTGSSTRGRRILEQRCLRCHSFDGVGGQLAPDLAKVGRKSREELLSDIFNPAKAMAPGYQTKVLQRTSNQLLVGLVQTVGADFVRVDQADGTRIFLPSNQVEDTFDQDWSLMPNSAASGLRASELADLLSFLQMGATGTSQSTSSR